MRASFLAWALVCAGLAFGVPGEARELVGCEGHVRSSGPMLGEEHHVRCGPLGSGPSLHCPFTQDREHPLYPFNDDCARLAEQVMEVNEFPFGVLAARGLCPSPSACAYGVGPDGEPVLGETDAPDGALVSLTWMRERAPGSYSQAWRVSTDVV